MLRSSAVAVLIAASLVLVAGCGDSGGAAAGPTRSAASKSGAVPALTGDPTNTSVEAKISAGGATPPGQLLTKDVVTGTGETAAADNTVAVRYTGALYPDGKVFDASWNRGKDPISFPLTGVVPGFSQGIVGMKVGGRREIVIPPALGYGAAGKGPVPADATMVFVVDLVKVS